MSSPFGPQNGRYGITIVLVLIGLTLYMAFAFPYTLFNLKQSETTELKSVIIVGRNGEESPTTEGFFIGEEPTDELRAFGFDQLTNIGKQRMYLLGKYLKLRYYSRLLEGNPRKVFVRSADSDKCLESAQALLAGLNPPQNNWIWSDEQLTNWQPMAIHTTLASDDDLLSSESVCLKMDAHQNLWKNSTKYSQLVNEFRHDLQTLRQNTGLEFEDDLEMLVNIEGSLRERKAFKESAPQWYTNTLADRLSYIADVTLGTRFASLDTQRLYVGRLLHEILENLSVKMIPKNSKFNNRQHNHGNSKFSFKKEHHIGDANMIIYMTDKNHLAALMNSLQIYSSQPMFGSMLLIELHYDPINQVHFLRLFVLNSSAYNMLPEPVRVNPIACADSIECPPEQFEHNLRRLVLNRASWRRLCIEHEMLSIEDSSTGGNSLPPVIIEDPQPTSIKPTESSPSTTPSSDNGTTTITISTMTTTESTTTGQDLATASLEKLEQTLIVGPLSVKPTTVNPDSVSETTTTTMATTTIDRMTLDEQTTLAAERTTTVQEAQNETTTTITSQIDQGSDS